MAENGEHYAELILSTVSQPIVVLTGDLEVETVNDAFCRLFQVTEGESHGCRFYELGNGQWNIPELRTLLLEVLSKQNVVKDYRVEHEFEQIGKRIMLLNARRMTHAKAERIVLAINDITEDARLRYELEGRAEFAEKLIDSIREGLLILHWDLRVHSANQSFYERFRVRPEETEGRLIYELGNGQWDIPELRILLEKILPEESSFNDYEVEHEFEGIGRRIMLLNGRRLDHLNLIILAIRDITERREHERRQRALMGELQHRVKNVLNNVRSVANQMRRRSTDLDQFFDAFLPRLAALSRAQDLLLTCPEQDIDLGKIVCGELEAVGAERGRTYTVDGPPLGLSPRNAQAFAMAIHELATNAGKYGALKTKGGRISVVWHIEREGAEELRFVWREHGVQIADTTRTRGFGSDVIEKSVPYMLDGTARLDLHHDGAECRITFPLLDEE